MPILDGTGPHGWGPRTGRGLGYCAPARFAGPGYRQPLLTREQRIALLKEDKEQIDKEIADLEQSV